MQEVSSFLLVKYGHFKKPTRRSSSKAFKHPHANRWLHPSFTYSLCGCNTTNGGKYLTQPRKPAECDWWSVWHNGCLRWKLPELSETVTKVCLSRWNLIRIFLTFASTVSMHHQHDAGFSPSCRAGCVLWKAARSSCSWSNTTSVALWAKSQRGFVSVRRANQRPRLLIITGAVVQR